jgi:HEAT repeat protein
VPGDIHHTNAATGIARTAQVLAKSPNRSVLPVLLAGLKSSRADIRASTIRAAFRRRDRATHAQLIEHFTFLSESDRIVVGDAHRSMPHHAAAALKAAILQGDANQCKNACRIVSISGDVDLLPTLVKAGEDKKHHFRMDVAATVLELATGVQRELTLWASGDRTAPHDPSFKRHHVLVSLEQSVSRFSQHRRKEILDAFLMLAPVDNATLKKILRDTNHACHSAVVAELTSTQDFAIIERLVEMLSEIEAPPAVLKIISRRTDERFVDILLNGLKRPVPVRVLHNMKSLNHVAWLEEQRGLLLELDARAQTVAVEMALVSGLDRGSIFELLSFLLQNGLVEARRACCQALAKFDNLEANKLVLSMLADPDAGVQAAAVRQLRARRVPDALQRLVALVDSRSPEVREAARSSLAEFNFTRYRTMFDLLDEQSAHTTGALVRKVDHSVPQKLAEELSSPSVSTKLRGIEMAIAMEATSDVRQQLIDLVGHENVAVRKEAVLALANCYGEPVIATLKSAATDPNHIIAEAAQQSLAKLLRERSYPIGAQRAGGTA